MSKEAEKYLKENNIDTKKFITLLNKNPYPESGEAIMLADLMQSYADSQIKDILIEFVESYNNNDE